MIQSAHCFGRSPLPIRKEKATPAANVPSALGRWPAFSERMAAMVQQVKITTMKMILSMRSVEGAMSYRFYQSSSPFPLRIRSTFFSMRASRVLLCFALAKWSR